VSARVTLIVLAVGAVTEAALLWALTHHQAGGWGDPGRAFWFLTLCGVAPLLGACVIPVRMVARHARARLQIAPYLAAVLAGPGAAMAALALYGHGIPVLLVFGVAVQGAAVVLGWSAGIPSEGAEDR
jgi:hypothetical protein